MIHVTSVFSKYLDIGAQVGGQTYPAPAPESYEPKVTTPLQVSPDGSGPWTTP